jgi:hypothetical protein
MLKRLALQPRTNTHPPTPCTRAHKRDHTTMQVTNGTRNKNPRDSHLPDVFHRHGLPACAVVGDGQHHDGHLWGRGVSRGFGGVGVGYEWAKGGRGEGNAYPERMGWLGLL